MLAARLHATGADLLVERVPTPVMRPGGALIRVEAAQVPAFTHAVQAGEFPFTLPTPYTLGSSAVGVVEAVADDVFGLRRGERVFCDPYLTVEQPGAEPAALIIGWFALSEGARLPQQLWRDGAFAERAVYPAALCTPLHGLDQVDSARLACLNYLNIGYGALLRGELRAGQTVIVTGATGNLGAATVLVALALGAGRVIAAGRDQVVLEQVAAADPQRIATVLLGGEASTASALSAAARTGGGFGADLLVDCVGLTDSAAYVLAGVHALRPGGTAVLVGGVAASVCLDYQSVLGLELTVRGSLMGPRTGPHDLVTLARSGLLHLDALEPLVFPLAQAQEAVNVARTRRGFGFTILAPNQGRPSSGPALPTT